MIDQLQLILKALPWTGPAVLGGFVLALLTTLLFPKRRSRTDRLGFALMTWCLVVAAVVTLSPVRNDYFGVPTLGCDWSVWRPLAREYWFSAGSRPPNVWLFFPAGVGAMLLDGVWRKILAVMVLFALPPGIETLQDLYPELKRSCSSQDVADNWTGLALGVAVGLVLAVLVAIVRALTRASRRRRERREGVLGGPGDGSGNMTEAGDGRGAAPAEAGPADAWSADGRPLPLGGRADERHYDEFGDFDDMPNSSRWYENRSAEPQDYHDDRSAAREGGVSDGDRRGGRYAGDSDADATRAMPRGDQQDRRDPDDRGVDHTPPFGMTPQGWASDEAPTQAVDTAPHGDHPQPDGGQAPRRPRRRDDDDTEIIRRS